MVKIYRLRWGKGPAKSHQSGLDQRAPFIRGSFVVWRNEMHKVTLGLVSDHFNDIGEELAFWFELDHIFSGGNG